MHPPRSLGALFFVALLGVCWLTPRADAAKPSGASCEIVSRPSKATLTVGQRYTPGPIAWRCPVDDPLTSASIDYGNGTVRACVVSSESFNKQMVTVTAQCESILYQKVLSRDASVTTPHSSLNLSWPVEVVERR